MTALHQTLRTAALLALIFGWPCLAGAASSPLPDDPCARDLETGREAAWLAKLGQARDAFRAAAEHAPCRVEALIGLAEIERRRDKDKAAVEAATAAIEEARRVGREDLLAEALFQLGRAIEEQGWRRNESRQQQAEAALREAVERSGGDHREALRALQRLYGDTGRDEELAAVREENPTVVATTRSERKRWVRPQRRGGGQPPDGDADADVPTLRPDETWTPPDDAPEALWGEALEAAVDAEEIVAPVLVETAEPEYTDEAREARIQGFVGVMALVDAEGVVERASAFTDLPMGLTEKALDAVRRSVYEPARTADGEAVAAWVPQTVAFRLEGETSEAPEDEDASEDEGEDETPE